MAASDAEDLVITLEQELADLEGVRSATVDVSGGEVTMLHVDLAEDADRERVATAVDAVLRRHGLRSRPRQEQAPEPLEEESTPYTPGPDVTETMEPEAEAQVRGAIESVSVTHRRGMVSCTVLATDGTEVSVSSVPREEARHQALAEAVAGALGHSLRPHVAEVRRQPVGGKAAVTVVLDLGEDLAVGTSFERGSAELAFARAVAAALDEA
ncbi:MAG: hypothetical protein JSV07_04540 [Acidimicrobiia bacterium]|nr:MAG: hypothetical protein JSV07_04540 [Acidimicrobiia bacterium]